MTIGVAEIQTLSRDFKGINTLVISKGVFYVRRTVPYLKIFGFEIRFLSHWYSRKESDTLQALDGIQGIPGFIQRLSQNSYLCEYIPGQTLYENQTVLSEEFFAGLERIVRETHVRGITHFNIGSPKDVIVMPDGSPGLIDFELAVSEYRGKGIFKWFNRLLFTVGKREDLYHLAKLKVRHRIDLATPEEIRLAEYRSLIGKIFTVVFIKPKNAVRWLYGLNKNGGNSRFHRVKPQPRADPMPARRRKTVVISCSIHLWMSGRSSTVQTAKTVLTLSLIN
jgi:predicted Ser/Thr protein kinase